MSDLIAPALGAPPWKPAGDVEPVLELDRYNVPLAGLVEQQGSLYMYVCALGEEDDANIWLYAAVGADEARALAEATEGGLNNIIAQCLRYRWVVAALASDFELVHWERFDAGEESPGGLVGRYIKRIRRITAQTQERLSVLDSESEQEKAQGRLTFA